MRRRLRLRLRLMPGTCAMTEWIQQGPSQLKSTCRGEWKSKHDTGRTKRPMVGIEAWTRVRSPPSSRDGGAGV